MNTPPIDPIGLFSDYMRITGVPTLDVPVNGYDPALAGKKLGIVNGSSWITLWSTWFGRALLPGVQLVNAGNEAVQLNFMAAHRRGEPCPPQANIDRTVAYARDLVTLHDVDAVLLTCSTMNRAAPSVRDALRPSGVPVVQIDEAMMELAVQRGGRILVVATHGPTVNSTQSLLRETAEHLGHDISFDGATVEQAFELLGEGRIAEHNEAIAQAIRDACRRGPIDTIVLAQLSMSIFSLSYPEPEESFGAPVLTSAETGFARAGDVLRGL